MSTSEPYYCLPVNVEFVALAIRDERKDTVSYLDLDTGGVFTLLVDDQAGPHTEGLDVGLRHNLEEHPERFVAIDTPTAREKRAFVAEFTEGLTDEHLKRRLRRAADVEAAFDACEEVLRPHTESRRRWDECLRSYLLAAALELLGENSIKPQMTLGAKERQSLREGKKS